MEIGFVKYGIMLDKENGGAHVYTQCMECQSLAAKQHHVTGTLSQHLLIAGKLPEPLS